MTGLTGRIVVRVVSAIVLALGGLVALAEPASAAASITVDPSTASPGDTLTISGNVPPDQCPSSDPAQLTSTADIFPPDGFGPPATRAPTGDFSTQYTLNATTPPGSYSIGVRCGGGNVGISADLTVVAAGAPASITVNPSTAAQGGTVTISGNVPNDGCSQGDSAQLTDTDLFPPDGFGPQVTRDAGGAFTTTYVVPASTPPGSYSVGVRCGGGNVGVSDTLQVTAATTTTSSTTSTTAANIDSSTSVANKKSDSNSLWWILLLMLLVLAVIGALVWRRRRAETPTPGA